MTMLRYKKKTRSINYVIRHYLSLSLLVLSATIISHNTDANTIELPSFGSTSARTIAEEQRIGLAWLKQYRRQVATLTDPITVYFLEDLLAKLAVHSGTNYSQLQLVVAKNNTLNAFAVPGGIIGVHTGIMRYAKTQDQLASILAHELAHLSQRHYARSVEKQKSQSVTTAAALLASLIIAATTDGDAGVAAISATQAYSIDQRLRFSRSFEQEADRIGMDILVKAGMDPHATEGIFKEMERINRFSSAPPEFLLTHPLTNSRIIDAINLARGFPKQAPNTHINYQFIRARALLATELSPQQAIKRFESEISGFDTSLEGSQYGLALALLKDNQVDRADQLVDELLVKYPKNPILHIAKSNLMLEKNQDQKAIDYIRQQLTITPNHYPLQAQLSDLYIAQSQYSAASDLLITITQQRPTDPYGWFQLAEVSGLNNAIALLHKARAEYFLLYGNFDSAQQQLEALLTRKKDSTGNRQAEAALYRYAEERLASLSQERLSAKL